MKTSNNHPWYASWIDGLYAGWLGIALTGFCGVSFTDVRFWLVVLPTVMLVRVGEYIAPRRRHDEGGN